MNTHVYVPVVKVQNADGEITERFLWSMTSDMADTKTKTQAEVWFSQFYDIWEKSYREMGYTMLSLRVAELHEI